MRPLINTFLDINPRGAVSFYLSPQKRLPLIQGRFTPSDPRCELSHRATFSLYSSENVGNAPVKRNGTRSPFSHHIASPWAIVMQCAVTDVKWVIGRCI
ncbi:hypothetical protein PUN28_006211 [Cardiocondyla obscurior]|uniref:Uncharacterized protein n=1 Tax=Cardiocondyla obscurior TaxID=286306 RepID=A0AAW2GDR3_9HYME